MHLPPGLARKEAAHEPADNPTLLPDPDDSASEEEFRAFALLLIPIYECEWQRALTSPTPKWTYLLNLHTRMVQLEQGVL